MIVTIILFLLIFGVIVISHEFGHFILAKKNGIKVLEFSVGMGPTLFYVQKKETKYSIKALPLGGSCVFEGEDGVTSAEGEHTEGSFTDASVWARISSVVAGPLFNFILAYVLALVVVAFNGSERPVIQEVMPGSAAEAAGIQGGDRITHLDGKRIHLGREISLLSALNQGEPVEVRYQRDGVPGQAILTPDYDPAAGRYYMGFLGVQELFQCNPLEVFQYSFYELKFRVDATFLSLKMLVAGKVSRDDVAGPVGIAQIVGDTYQEAKSYGAAQVTFSMMDIAILLSVNLGIINLLPLPALDGGRLVFLLVEAVRGKPIPPEKEGMVHLAGMVVLMGLMVFIVFNDISRILGF